MWELTGEIRSAGLENRPGGLPLGTLPISTNNALPKTRCWCPDGRAHSPSARPSDQSGADASHNAVSEAFGGNQAAPWRYIQADSFRVATTRTLSRQPSKSEIVIGDFRHCQRVPLFARAVSAAAVREEIQHGGHVNREASLQR